MPERMRAELPFSLNSRQLHQSNQHLIIRACFQAIDALLHWPALMMVHLDGEALAHVSPFVPAPRFGENFRYERLYL